MNKEQGKSNKEVSTIQHSVFPVQYSTFNYSNPFPFRYSAI